ncbi:hypothetical protein IV203_025751 [Nitzschia inconspicua]|uniref:DUF6824 domain-containing protein n=1 Tax=Nitzschia inconspicua TaxID=303405 RepID=A0A9K3LHP5_9STRA|nr:hypothetical protein IV203_025751 [Nitzschia inconspicua]
MTSLPKVFHYQTSKKYSRAKSRESRKNVPQELLDGGILPQGFKPAATDILCGRGKAFANHPGNKSFSDVIKRNLDRYIDAPKRQDKSLVVASVVSEILNYGARFVKKEKVSGRWYQMNEDQAHEKTGHAIRDLIKSKSVLEGTIVSCAPVNSSSCGQIKSKYKTPSKSAEAKKKMKRLTKTQRPTSLEQMNIFNQEFCVNTFESDVARNLSLTTTDLLARALEVQQGIDVSDDSCSSTLQSVVSDKALYLPGICETRRNPHPGYLDDVVEIFPNDRFFRDVSAIPELRSSTAECAFIDDLSLPEESDASSSHLMADLPRPLQTAPNSMDFARVYELLSSDDDESSVDNEEFAHVRMMF